MWKTLFKNLLAHKGRLVRTVIAVVLGVGFVSGTYVLTDTLDKIFSDITTESTAGVDVYVRGENAFVKEISYDNDRPPVPEELLRQIANVEGVEVATGSLGGQAVLVDEKGDPIRNGFAPTFGFSWTPPPLSPVQLSKGREPVRAGEVVIDAWTAEDNGIKVGDRVGVAIKGPAEDYRVVGVVTFGEAGNMGGATAAIFDLETAQREFQREREFDSIEIAAAEGVSVAELQKRVSAALPNGFQAVAGEAVSEEMQSTFDTMLGFFSTALLVFALISLFVGAFIIFNTFSIIVAQRVREFALLRALGASGRQVLSSVVAEALMVGLVASVIGLFAGLGIAAGLQRLLTAFGMELPNSGLRFLPRTAFVSIGLGLMVTVISAVVPARRASRVPPLAAMREESLGQARGLTRRTVVGASLLAIGGAIAMTGLFGDVSNNILYVGLGALTTFIAVAALSPLLAKPFTQIVARPLHLLSRVTGNLARENSMRNRRRTATTAAALMIGVALVSFVAIFSTSIKASSSAGLDKSIKADYVIGTADATGMILFSPRVAQKLERVPEVAAASALRSGEFRFEGSSAMLVAADPRTISRVVDLDVVDGDLTHLLGGGIAISDRIAEKEDLQVGDIVDVGFARTGEHLAGVDAIFDNGAAIQGDYVISLDLYERSFTEQQDFRIYVQGKPDVSRPALLSAVNEAVEGFPSLEVMDQAELKEAQSRQIDQMLGLVSALLGLAIIIAVIGIGNTLSLSILERTRELGLLRAVGMTRHQMRTMVRWEAALIALFGALLGLAVGTFFGWAVTTSLKEEGINKLSFPIFQLAIYAVAAGVAGVIAAIGPAHRAAKLDVLRAIASD